MAQPFSGVAQPPFRDRSILRHGRPFVKRCYFRFGSSTDLAAPKFDFRSSPESGLRSDIGPCPFGAILRPEELQHLAVGRAFLASCGKEPWKSTV